MTEPASIASRSLEALASPIGSLKGVMLVTVEDALLYRAWQRQGERWSAEMCSARYGDVVRAARAGLGQLGGQLLDQLTIETSDALALLVPLSDSVFAILLFDLHTPLGLARYHASRLLGGLRALASAVGPVGAAASRRASAVAAASGNDEPPQSQPPPPPPPSPVAPPPVVPVPVPAPVVPAPVAPPVSSPLSSSSAPSAPLMPPAAGSPAARPSPTLVTPHGDESWDDLPRAARHATTLVTGSMPVADPGPPPPPPPAMVTAGLEDEDTSPDASGLAEPITRPRKTSPLPGPERSGEPQAPGERARDLFGHLSQHSPDAHIALLRVALQTGLPLETLRAPARLGAHDLTLVEAAVRRILGLERLHV